MKSVLVTGASSGFGVEIALDCAKRGWDVFASMRNLDRGEALERSARDRGVSARVHAIQLDVTGAGSIRAAVGTALRLAGGRLDAVVHNAGIGLGGAFEDVTDEDVRRIMDTNFFGVLAVTRALLPSFRSARHGRIVIVSSESACAGQPAMSASASKWAVEAGPNRSPCGSRRSASTSW
jgi:NAD(P)-dependent dehydrogenase (short-subunit alcohol dehydrogenase family)